MADIVKRSKHLENKLPTSDTNKRVEAKRHMRLAKLDPDAVKLIRSHDSKAAAELAAHTDRRKQIDVTSYFDFMVNEIALKRNNQDFYNGLSFDRAPDTAQPTMAFCDYIRCTQPDISLYQDFCSKAFPYFTRAGFDIVDTGNGMNGYEVSWALRFNGAVAGHFCASKRMGGLFELTGLGCRMVQANWGEWRKLTWSLNTLGFRLTRLDVSVDFAGYDWFHYGVTVPQLASMGKFEGLFQVGSFVRTSPKFYDGGDWSDITFGVVSVDDYNPAVHCPGGLTFNFGRRGGQNQFCVYEKGKEQLGKKLVDSLTDIEASAVRIERRYCRGSAGKTRVEINWDFTVLLDEAFVYNCEGLDSFVKDFIDFKGGSDLPPKSGIKIERIKKAQSSSLIKKGYHAMLQSGKFVHTLFSMGFSSDFIVNLLMNKDKAIDGFIDDITDCDDIASAFLHVKKTMFGGGSGSGKKVSSSGKAKSSLSPEQLAIEKQKIIDELGGFDDGFVSPMRVLV